MPNTKKHHTMPIKMNNVKENGFTLVELLVVITILSILAAGTSFAIIKNKPDYNLQMAANTLFLDFQLAKSKAVLHQEQTRIQFDLPTSSYRIFRLGSDGAEGGNGTAADTPIKQVKLSDYGSGVSFGRGQAPQMTDSNDILTYTLDRATFNINGSSNERGYVYMTHIEKDRCFAVGTPNISGIVRIYRAVNGKWEKRL